jgi:diguanylate cyclase (GGDEF)-like protein
MSDSTPSRAELEAQVAEVTRQLTALREEVAQLRAQLELRDRAVGLLDEALTLQATADPLTGLFTLREFRHRTLAEWGRFKRHQRPLSLLLVGLDRFERIAELHGQECGDTVLQGIGAIFRAKQRRHDVDCRYGSAEFALLLPETTLEQAFLVAGQVRRRIEEARFPCRDAELRVTASVGVANAPGQHPLSDEALLRLAEAGRLRAARDGGAQIVAVDPLDPERVLRRDASPAEA